MSFQRGIKRGLDVSMALALFIIFFPLFVSISLLLLVVQGRPILFRHARIGRNGEAFECLKFRTMVFHAQRVLEDHLAANPMVRREWEANQKLKNDPRITQVGNVIRRLSIDELPQLFNVLKGEMSLVGPRPIVRSETRFYGTHIHVYQTVRPGITGPWQVGGRSDTSYARRVDLDVDYITHWSLARDFVILVKTIPVVFTSNGSY